MTAIWNSTMAWILGLSLALRRAWPEVALIVLIVALLTLDLG